MPGYLEQALAAAESAKQARERLAARDEEVSRNRAVAAALGAIASEVHRFIPERWERSSDLEPWGAAWLRWAELMANDGRRDEFKAGTERLANTNPDDFPHDLQKCNATGARLAGLAALAAAESSPAPEIAEIIWLAFSQGCLNAFRDGAHDLGLILNFAPNIPTQAELHQAKIKAEQPAPAPEAGSTEPEKADVDKLESVLGWERARVLERFRDGRLLAIGLGFASNVTGSKSKATPGRRGRKPDPARDEAIWKAIQDGKSQAEVGRLFKKSDGRAITPSAVRHACKRHEETLKPVN